jgi:hypothetical protein
MRGRGILTPVDPADLLSLPGLRLRFFRYRFLRALRRARREGKGLYVGRWRFEQGHAGMPGHLAAWCAEMAGATRRPYGIARFDLTVVARAADGRLRRLRLPGLDAAEFYRPEFEKRLSPLVPAAGATVAAMLFAWGDVTHAALMALQPRPPV